MFKHLHVRLTCMLVPCMVLAGPQVMWRTCLIHFCPNKVGWCILVGVTVTSFLPSVAMPAVSPPWCGASADRFFGKLTLMHMHCCAFSCTNRYGSAFRPTTGLNKFFSDSQSTQSCPTTWRSHRDHRLLWRHCAVYAFVTRATHRDRRLSWPVSLLLAVACNVHVYWLGCCVSRIFSETIAPSSEPALSMHCRGRWTNCRISFWRQKFAGGGGGGGGLSRTTQLISGGLRHIISPDNFI